MDFSLLLSVLLALAWQRQNQKTDEVGITFEYVHRISRGFFFFRWKQSWRETTPKDDPRMVDVVPCWSKPEFLKPLYTVSEANEG